jgi:RNA recognition motif-containing protein
MKLYVGNLSYQTTEADLRREFERYGNVNSVDMIIDRDTGRSKGFAFVEMPDNNQANEAIRALDGATLGDRTLKVNEAQPKGERGGGGGGGGKRFGVGGGGGGNRDRRY